MDAMPSNQIALIIIVDLRGFKNINDTFGHVAGDKILQVIAKRCKNVNARVISRSTENLGRRRKALHRSREPQRNIGAAKLGMHHDRYAARKRVDTRSHRT